MELMREQRRDPTTGLTCIVAPERGARPMVTRQAPSVQLDPAACPFCPGNEHTTMQTLAWRGDPWSVRAFPNKYPALRVEGETWNRADGGYAVQDGVGAHEVIVESPVHDRPLWTQPGQQRLALDVARERMADLARDERIRHLLWFRNRGVMAGASQPHPHAQVLGGTAVPPLVEQMTHRFKAYQQREGRPLMSALLDWEEQQGHRWLGSFGGVRAFCAYAPRVAFETWIVPANASPRFREASDADLTGLADALDAVLRGLADLLDDPSFNVVIYEAPRDGESGFGWHARVMPRLVAPAGWELGGGGSIVHVAPEHAATLLRGAMGDEETSIG